MVNADFFNSSKMMDQQSQISVVDIKSPSRFFNRELSWISFNWRVLEEAENQNIPILERVRFLAISASNLDEFYSVRVAGLREMVKENISFPSVDGIYPSEQLLLVEKEVRALIKHQQIVWRKLLVELKNSSIVILEINDLSKTDYKVLQDVF